MCFIFNILLNNCCVEALMRVNVSKVKRTYYLMSCNLSLILQEPVSLIMPYFQ